VIDLRPPRAGDGSQIQTLLAQLGYDIRLDVIEARINALAHTPADRILLAADQSQILGLIALHWTAFLQADRPIARITTMVVHEAARGQGIGRSLVEAAATLATQAGCGILELTTALHRTDARAFYETIGFTFSSWRMSRPL
jgi:GNAT superfamily N-acetyltransferase